MMDKLKMHSADKVREHIEQIRALFPNCVTETKNDKGETTFAVDFDMLRQELSDVVVDGPKERYQFTWPDKRKSVLAANAPIAKTLRPCRAESVNFDTTENLYIEGDNLDVLKLLQETYLGKVKMIYIDPPYNTGNDFVYEDDFSESAEEYMARSGDYDEEGNRLVKNLDSNGRFHTDWLNMIYPRLKLAKDLLTDDGVIFISMDINEIANAQKICNEVFGADNCVGVISNTNNPKGRSDDKYVATAHEYILIYAKTISSITWGGFEPSEEITKRYNKIDSHGKRYREIDLRKTGENDLREDRPNLFYYFYYSAEKNDFFPDSNDYSKDGYIQIKPQREDGREGNWRWGIDTARKQIDELIPKFMPTRKVWGVMQKDYLEDRALVKPTSSWTFKDVNSERGTEDFTGLDFDKRIFPKPKPLGTIKRCLNLGANSGCLILDFFSGSATTAHAVMQLNAEDGGHRKFIMVQLPEETDEKSEAYKAGYKNICEIGKERIRRAGTKIMQEVTSGKGTLNGEGWGCGMPSTKEEWDYATKNILDVGFRVLKVDSTNMQEVYYNPAAIQQSDLLSLADNIKRDRTEEDLLFQVMLDLGILLSSKIEQTTIGGKTVYSVADGYLLVCFDDGVTDEVVTEVAKQKPYYFVMRDSSLASDATAANFDQIFQTYSSTTVRKVL